MPFKIHCLKKILPYYLTFLPTHKKRSYKKIVCILGKENLIQIKGISSLIKNFFQVLTDTQFNLKNAQCQEI